MEEEKVDPYPECFVCSSFVKKGLVVHHTHNFYDQFYFCGVECMVKCTKWHLVNPPDIKVSDRNESTKDQGTQTSGIYHPCKTQQRFICHMLQ